jgi:hypothetical protein
MMLSVALNGRSSSFGESVGGERPSGPPRQARAHAADRALGVAALLFQSVAVRRFRSNLAATMMSWHGVRDARRC